MATYNNYEVDVGCTNHHACLRASRQSRDVIPVTGRKLVEKGMPDSSDLAHGVSTLNYSARVLQRWLETRR
ncbi:hypothetical protein KQX54_000715 [Cotesia glomerata]|uniref:Uncharacterized protein n=1 Tax=Cotesia glomerata TaxID=32391 RepID=A0AAV7HPX5_COTGL|nr:hypothetical protein KQX54_000715 [Cotesia glomerata]